MTELSQFALLRAFRSETGLPPHAYLNQVRVRRARLLLDDGVSAADVAAQVGFAEWTNDGRLRHPSYLGQRDDKAPTDVVREPG